MAPSGDTLLDPEVWAPALAPYAAVAHLTVQLYDAAARPAGGPVHPTPLYELVARGGRVGGFAECAGRCLTLAAGAPEAVVEESNGLAVVGTALRLDGGLVGAAVAGYALTGFSSTLSLERLARDHHLAFEALWGVARSLPPVPPQRLALYGQLLRVLADAILTEQARSREHARLYREAREASHVKDEFLATLSHELRGPLNAIVGWVQVARTMNQDPALVGRALDTIERNVRAQAQIVEDLLDVSRIITGRMRLDLGPVDLMPLIEAVLDAVRPAAQAKAIRLDREGDSAVGPVVGDAGRLQQVLWNLLSNAVKFTPAEGRVAVRARRVDSKVEIAVSDTGEGIRPEFLPHVFDRFSQADPTSSRRHTGLGLGLGIVRHLVELHGGTVHAGSAGPGQGATFTVTLPLSGVQETVTDPEARETAEPGRPVSGIGAEVAAHALDGVVVLVVDDEADGREWLSAVLEHCGARVTTAASAPEAIECLGRLTPDVLIVDIGMPGEDGYSLVRTVRALPPERGGCIPAVALTAYARREDRDRALAAGFQRHVAKPVEVADLIATVAALATPAGEG